MSAAQIERALTGVSRRSASTDIVPKGMFGNVFVFHSLWKTCGKLLCSRRLDKTMNAWEQIKQASRGEDSAGGFPELGGSDNRLRSSGRRYDRRSRFPMRRRDVDGGGVCRRCPRVDSRSEIARTGRSVMRSAARGTSRSHTDSARRCSDQALFQSPVTPAQLQVHISIILWSVPATSSRMRRRRRSPPCRRAATIRCSSTAEWVWGRPT